MAFFRIRRSIEQTMFYRRCRGVLSTPPLKPDGGKLTVVSMVSENDVLPYLLAAKSFLTSMGVGRPLILNDGSLCPDSITLLCKHLPSAVIRDLSGIDTGPCPTGGCWERLTAILRLTPQSYVIQLDSDTVTTGAVDEVRRCYEANCSFTLGTGMGRRFVTVRECREMISGLSSEHVQIAAERALSGLPHSDTLRYVRGSAGFAGFARNCFEPERLVDFSVRMQEMIGDKWNEWGSEQVASNYVVANSTSAEVLPYPKYACFAPNIRYTQCAFLHFVGTHRYFRGVYGDVARRRISEIHNAMQKAPQW